MSAGKAAREEFTMKRSLLPILICVFAICVFAGNAARADEPAQTPPAQQPSRQVMADAQKACASDIKTLCPAVQPGGGRILACLKEHKESVSAPCKQAIMKVLQGSN